MKLTRRTSRRRAVAEAGAKRRAGDAAAAVEILAPVLMADEDDAAANVEMARALHVLDDLAGAEEHYRRALREELDYKLVVELAGVVGSAGRIKEAEELLGAALQMTQAVEGLDPGEALLVSATLAAGQGDNDRARSILDEIDAGSSEPEVLEFSKRLRDRLR